MSLRSTAMIVVLSLLAVLPAIAGDQPRTATDRLPVKEITLDNGLRIFVLERSTSPTFAAIYTFDVGGAVDPKGRSGIAHLLEHMMFKGTTSIGTLDPEKEAQIMQRLDRLWSELTAELDKQRDPFAEPDEERIKELKQQIEQTSAEHKQMIVKNEYDEIVTRAGEVGLNATTNYDATTYMIALPANMLELWFRLEADRLLNPVFREFYSERDVVHEERRLRTENQPGGRMRETLHSLMFQAHPYRTPVVGWPLDLDRLERTDAETYFRKFYSPSNCVMVLAGDVKEAEVRKLAARYLGPWERQELTRPTITEEPEQQGPRRAVVEFDARPRITMGWVTVPQGHPDSYALDVLAQVLGGLQSSRLDQTVVQQERLAAGAFTGHLAMRYGGYLMATAFPQGEHTVEELEGAIEREIARIQQDSVTAEELARAQARVEASQVRTLKSNFGMAYRVASSVRTTGSPDYIYEYEQRLAAVTPADVQRVARHYLKPARKNVVTLNRNPEAARGSERTEPLVAHQRGGVVGKRGATHSAGFKTALQTIQKAKPVKLTIPEVGKDVERVELDSGIVVFLKEDRSAPSIQMSFAWLGGYNTAPIEELAVFELASDLLNEGGTSSHAPMELEQRIDELGMSFYYDIGSTTSSGAFWSLSRNFDESYGLALEMLMEPRLDPERLETIRGQYIESMRRRYDSPNAAARWVESWVFDRDHPRLGYVPSRKQIEEVTVDQIRRVWQRYLGRDNLYVTAVGDFEGKQMLERIDSTLGKWREAQNTERNFLEREPVVRPGLYVVEKDVPQPVVRIREQIAIDRTAPLHDHAALEILNDILGGSGFRSRLMERLRSDEGLTYGVRSSVRHQGRPGVPGAIGISYSTKKASVAHSINSVLEEYRRMVATKVTAAEVEEQIQGWRNRFIFRYTDDFFSVSRLMMLELDDRPYDWEQRELAAVQQVTVADVERVARKYLKPENLTISVFGRLTDPDVAALKEQFSVTVLDKGDVFTGGYDEDATAAKGATQPTVGGRSGD